ncbi:MAG: hypothetical protein ACLPYS_10280 [Vulcanimicrobiaceae bacterium]
MSDQEATASYVDIAGEVYGLYVDAFASANQRLLDYYKSVWEITARPYASNAIEATVRENFDRVNEIVSLTVTELQNNGQKTAEFTQALFKESTKLQDSTLAAIKGLVNTSVSNAAFVKDTVTEQFNDLTKRLEEVQSRVTVASNN